MSVCVELRHCTYDDDVQAAKKEKLVTEKFRPVDTCRPRSAQRRAKEVRPIHLELDVEYCFSKPILVRYVCQSRHSSQRVKSLMAFDDDLFWALSFMQIERNDIEIHGKPAHACTPVTGTQ